MGQAASRTQPAPLRAYALAGGFALTFWDDEEAARARELRVGTHTPSRRPSCSCSVRLTPRRVRNLLLVAANAADDGTALAVIGPDGRVLACSQQHSLSAELDAAGLLTGVEPRDKARVLRFFLETCPAAAPIGADPRWIAACRGLIAVIGHPVRALDTGRRLVGNLRLYEGLVPAALDGRARAVLITERGLRRPAAVRLSTEVIGRQRRLLHLIVADEIGAGPATVVVFASDGAIIRTLPAATRADSPPLLGLFRQGSAADVRRNLLYDGLAELTPSEPNAAALLRELRLLLPEPAARRRPQLAKPLAGIDEVISSSAGLFIRGWLDPSLGLSVAFEVESGFERHRLPAADLVTSPLTERSGCAIGFVAGVVVGNPEAPCRVRLRLGSGLSIDLATGPDSLDARQARDRVLASLPASLAADCAVGVIEPVVQALHLAAARTSAPPVAATIGPPPAEPLVSIIVPLGHAAEPVRCRVARAAMAADAARCEFVYVLDRPNDFASAQRVLSDLYLCCGMGGTLLLMQAASNPASSLNIGAAAARGRYLLFLNSGTVPETADWLQPLLSHLAPLADTGAVAGTVIHPDQSLHQLGGDVGEDAFERWGPRWHAAGFPRATTGEAEPLLLAMPGLMLAKSCLDRLGGFDPSYFDPGFRDADFSLRLRESGGRLALVRPSLFLEFEDAQPAPSTAGGTGRELDRRRFERRWRGLVDVLRPAPQHPSAEKVADARIPRSARRRRAA